MTSLSLHCISSRHQRESMMELKIYYPNFVIICVNCVQSARSRCGWRITLTPQTLHECIFEFSAASVLIKVVHWWWHFDEWVVYRFSYISHTIHENRIDTGCVCARVGWNNSAKEHHRKKTIPRARWWDNSSNHTINSICLGYTFFCFDTQYILAATSPSTSRTRNKLLATQTLHYRVVWARFSYNATQDSKSKSIVTLTLFEHS